MLYNVLLFLIPLICIIGCYSAIYLKVRNGQKELLALLSSNSDSDDLRKNVDKTNSQLFRMIMIICACFVVFIVPKLALKVTLKVSSISVSDVANLDRLVTVLVFLNSIVNPFVYYFTNKSFREAFIQILPTKLRNIVIKKGPSVEMKQYTKSHGNQTHLTISTNTVTPVL